MNDDERRREDPHRPLIIAHRGASADVAEHTLGAYQRAIDDGADGLECDVRLTLDGHLVCVHDRTVNRTSNGSGVVSTLELKELADLDFASWRQGAEEPDVLEMDGGTVLTLARLLELVRDSGRKISLSIETKHPTRYARLVEERLVETLDRFGLAQVPLGQASSVRVMSFSYLGLRRVKRMAPNVPRVLLMDRVPLRFRDGSLPPGVRIAGPSIDILRAHPNYARRVKERGGRVHCWTVDDLADVDLCLELEVDAIITNRPGAVLRHLGETTGSR